MRDGCEWSLPWKSIDILNGHALSSFWAVGRQTFPNPQSCSVQALGSAARTISTSTFRASSKFWTSCRKLMRVPFIPSPVFSRR